MKPRTRAILLRLAVCLGVATAVAPTIVACQPSVVLARFPDGTPKMVKVIGPEHTDYELIGAGDRECALIGICIGWDKPERISWHQHGYTSCAYGVGGGSQGCSWTPVGWSEWHDFYRCDYYPENTCNEDVHDFLLYTEANSGV